MNDLLLLAALAEGPKHGYRLKKETGYMARTGEMHNNIVYPLLKRLTSQKLINWRLATGKRGQTRREYSLTTKGREYLIKKLSKVDAGEMQSGEDFLVRLGLFGLLDPGKRLHILARRRESIEEREERLAKITKALPLDEFGAEVMSYLTEKTNLERRLIERVAAKEARRG